MRVELLDHFGDDTMIANVARVSYAKEASGYTPEQNARLLKFLWNHGHVSPFRHPTMQFRILCPIYVERQLFKHQVGMSANSISGRYVDFSDTYTRIKDWRKQSEDSKQGSSGELEANDAAYCELMEAEVINLCQNAYQALINKGVSKEQARTVLPLSLNTEFIWTGTLLSFIHLFNLRLKKDAQKETREVVQMMYKEIAGINAFNETLKIVKKDWII
jgi:thymidylate synthase (FAD)